MRPLMLTGNTSLDQVAAHLDLHPRTLGRRLETEGTDFGAFKDEVRLAVARELLLITGLASRMSPPHWAMRRPAPLSMPSAAGQTSRPRTGAAKPAPGQKPEQESHLPGVGK